MITVLQPGLASTIQDEGRLEYLAFGLPRAGVMDRYAASMGNLLCGNPVSAAVLEMTLLGGTFRFDQPCRIALCGADMQPRLNGKPTGNWRAMAVDAGDVLETGYASSGCRAYLAVAGGFAVPLVMGSRSTYTRARLGGVDGRILKADDRLPLGEAPPFSATPAVLPSRFIPAYPDQITLRVLLGPQDDLFLPAGIDTLFSGKYRVSDEADRMGYRLAGPEIRHQDKADIVSDALGIGAIQVPGSGQPIVMMADCGTTGGYAKIGAVIGADLWKLAQAKPQVTVRFLRCTDAEAVEALRAEQDQYRQAAQYIFSACNATPRIVGAVRRLNLSISGRTYEVEIAEVKQDEDN
ncbi:MAG: biotin-dependent carboxyltransferase [Veillonellaceae bacterium]|nr:biotin-dependent carboxyltransferase [Veillonellaceae bacterium]